MKQNKYTHLIWDFNGTIMDDVKAGIDSVNQMLSERSLPIIPSVEAYRDIFDFPIEEYYRSLGFDFVKASLCNLTTCPWHPQHSLERLIGLFPCISSAQKEGIMSNVPMSQPQKEAFNLTICHGASNQMSPQLVLVEMN